MDIQVATAQRTATLANAGLVLDSCKAERTSNTTTPTQDLDSYNNDCDDGNSEHDDDSDGENDADLMSTTGLDDAASGSDGCCNDARDAERDDAWDYAADRGTAGRRLASDARPRRVNPSQSRGDHAKTTRKRARDPSPSSSSRRSSRRRRSTRKQTRRGDGDDAATVDEDDAADDGSALDGLLIRDAANEFEIVCASPNVFNNMLNFIAGIGLSELSFYVTHNDRFTGLVVRRVRSTDPCSVLAHMPCQVYINPERRAPFFELDTKAFTTCVRGISGADYIRAERRLDATEIQLFAYGHESRTPYRSFVVNVNAAVAQDTHDLAEIKHAYALTLPVAKLHDTVSLGKGLGSTHLRFSVFEPDGQARAAARSSAIREALAAERAGDSLGDAAPAESAEARAAREVLLEQSQVYVQIDVTGSPMVVMQEIHKSKPLTDQDDDDGGDDDGDSGGNGGSRRGRRNSADSVCDPLSPEIWESLQPMYSGSFNIERFTCFAARGAGRTVTLRMGARWDTSLTSAANAENALIMPLIMSCPFPQGAFVRIAIAPTVEDDEDDDDNYDDGASAGGNRDQRANLTRSSSSSSSAAAAAAAVATMGNGSANRRGDSNATSGEEGTRAERRAIGHVAPSGAASEFSLPSMSSDSGCDPSTDDF